MDNVGSDNIETLDGNLPVACITTDFAMQVKTLIDNRTIPIAYLLKNVLIQLGIPVLSVDGLLIRTARSYVLKCRVCPG